MFGNDGVAAVKKEMLQLHDRKVMIAKKSVDLTRDQKREALEYLMFLKRKRGERVKGRGCADGHCGSCGGCGILTWYVGTLLASVCASASFYLSATLSFQEH